MGLRERGKWIWARLSDISLAKDIIGWVWSLAGLKVMLAAIIAAGAALLGRAEQLPGAILMLVILLAAAVAIWLIDQAATFVAKRRNGGGASPPVARSGLWGSIAIVVGIAVIAVAWPDIKPTPIEAAKPAPKEAAPPVPAPAPHALPPAVPSPVTRTPALPKGALQTSPAPASRRPKSKPAPPPGIVLPAPVLAAAEPRVDPAAVAAAAEAAKAARAEAQVRAEAQIETVRKHRDDGDPLFKELFDASSDERVRLAIAKIIVWDRQGGDLVLDYWGQKALDYYAKENGQNDPYMEPHYQTLSVDAFFKRIAYMNLIRARQLSLGALANSAREASRQVVAPSPSAQPSTASERK